MSEKTEISWCDSTVNFVSGCEKVSPGWVCDCGNWAYLFPPNASTTCVKCGDQMHRRRIFALSLSDWLWDRIPVGVWLRIMHTIWSCPDVDWMLLTKRSESWYPRMMKALDVITDGTGSNAQFWQWLVDWLGGKPPSNVLVGTTVENQAMANKRIPELLKIHAAVRFLSCEPLLEPIDLAKAGALWSDMNDKIVPGGGVLGGISWVIIGGESGRGARACNIQWIRNLKDQCAAAKVPCFVKQLGSKALFQTADAQWAELRTKKGGWHPKGGDPTEWLDILKVQQWPESRM